MSTAPKRGPGRPALGEVTVRLDVPISEQLLRLVEERAEREGISRVEWVRRVLLQALAR